MYYYSETSSKKIIHSSKCSHVQNVDIDSVGSFETLEEAYRQGYRLCRHCSPLAKRYRKESESLVNYCQGHAVSVFFNDRFIGIHTPHSKWKIILSADGSELVLYHRNTFETKKDCTSPVKNYHYQRVRQDSVLGYLEYIAEHEYYRMMHPVEILPHHKKSTLPMKGTKRYKKLQKKAEQYARKQSITNVLNLIDSLQVQSQRQTALAT